MLHRPCAVTQFVIKDGKHGVTGRIAGPQSQDPRQVLHCVRTPFVVLDLRCTFQRREIVWRESQGSTKRIEGLFLMPLTRIRQAL